MCGPKPGARTQLVAAAQQAGARRGDEPRHRRGHAGQAAHAAAAAAAASAAAGQHSVSHLRAEAASGRSVSRRGVAATASHVPSIRLARGYPIFS